MAKKKTKKKAASRAVVRAKPSKKPATRSKSAKKATTRKRTSARAKQQAAGDGRKATAAQTQAAPAPPKPGSFVWHELMTKDVSRCKDFYGRLFGWKMQDDEMMPGFIYTVISNGPDMVGGMMAIAPEQGDMPSHWMVYVSVRDVDAIAERAEELGGEVVVPAHDIPVGRWALLRDPTGAAIAIYKSRRAPS